MKEFVGALLFGAGIVFMYVIGPIFVFLPRFVLELRQRFRSIWIFSVIGLIIEDIGLIVSIPQQLHQHGLPWGFYPGTSLMCYGLARVCQRFQKVDSRLVAILGALTVGGIVSGLMLVE